MTLERNEHVEVIKDGGYARRQRVVEYKPETRQILVSRISKLVWFITTVLTGLIAFRFGLKMLAANPANGFTDAIYKITDALVAPFVGIVGTPTFGQGAIVDIPSIFAIVVYILITAAFITLFRIVFSGTNGTRRVSTVERQS